VKIAFLTRELPPEHIGGIGSYIAEAAQMLTERGHQVEIFVPSKLGHRVERREKLQIHWLALSSTTRDEINQEIAQVVAERHRLVPFDVLESPEFQAQGIEIRQFCPDLPIVVKLHTCSLLLTEMNYIAPSRLQKLRFYFGAWRRGQTLKPYWWRYQPDQDPERQLTQAADLVVSPSRSLLSIMERRWRLKPQKSTVVPYPYTPNSCLLSLEQQSTGNQRVLYLGRLERRKGVLALAEAIPLVLRRCSTVEFYFVGSSLDSPIPGVSMRQYLEEQLAPFASQIHFQNPVPRERLHEAFQTCNICVFPSLWENFPNVCLEAMAASRAVIASRHGGMAEMLEHRQSGLLINPRSPQTIAKHILQLVNNPNLQKQLGRLARHKVLSTYNAKKILPLQENSYRQAIKNFAQKLVL